MNLDWIALMTFFSLMEWLRCCVFHLSVQIILVNIIGWFGLLLA